MAGGVRLLERAWEAAAAGPAPPPEAGSGTLRVLQFNTLADGLAQQGGFVRCPAAALAWEARRPLLEAELARGDADLLGLQEVNHCDDWLRGFLEKRGYAVSFLPKGRSPCLKLGFPADGIALAFKADRFELRELEQRPYEGFGQGSALATLREKESGRALVFGTTHLKAKPEGAAVRERQAGQLAERVAAAAEVAGAGCAVVVTGDFNEERGAVTAALEAGAVPLRDACAGWAANGEGGKPFTTWKFRPRADGGEGATEKREWIDFILAAGALRVGRRLGLPSANTIGPGGLPCPAYPSDHLAVAVEFVW